jgi:plastocyanin
MRIPRAIACAAAAALLAGCGHDKGSSSEATTGAKPNTLVVQGLHVLAIFDVHETEYELDPKTTGLLRTGYFGIKAINDGKIAHALAVTGPGVRAATGTLEPGESKTIAVWFKKSGVYKLYCPLGDHERRGMTGTIRVQ